MGRPKGNKRLAAEKALKAAIEDETQSLRVELRAAEQRIDELETILGNISQTASNAVLAKPKGIRPPIPPMPDIELPSGPAVDLAEGDALGEGRWV